MRRAFLLGLTTGIVYFTGTLYWITLVMALYGAMAFWVAVLINAALIAYLALFPAIFAMAMRRLISTAGVRALLAAPFVWVASEMGRTYFFTGFPWVLLGYSQVEVLPVAQLASLVGVYGVSGLVAGVSAAMTLVAVAPRAMKRDRYLPAAVMLALVVAVAIWGSIRVGRGELTRLGDPVRVGLVQGNVDQGAKWNADRAANIFQNYLALTRQAVQEGATLVLWPESSTPFYFEVDRADSSRVRALASQAKVTMLVGSDQVERGEPNKYFNSAFLVQQDGSVGGIYRKMHLVPFGEYVPAKRVFFFAAPLVEAVSDFSPGEEAVLLPVGRHLVSTAICYEIVYPDLVRQFVAGGSELLTAITNDAWFGQTSAPYQHFEQASMRAIENGRYLVRSANTGISGIVDPYGRVLAKSEIFVPAVVVGEARFLKTTTFYTRTGDLFAYASIVLTVGLLLVARRRPPPRRVQ
jgi:apolipoprotein N-acyltransferase